jgi:transcriptional regulator with XRE-family HTH domain
MEEETHGQRVRRLRKALGWTQEDLQSEASLDQSTLSGLENKNAIPKGDSLVRIAKALGTTAEYVMTGRNAAWPFARIPVERFLALSARDRDYIEGRLEAAIEVCEQLALRKNAVVGESLTRDSSDVGKDDPEHRENRITDELIRHLERSTGIRKSGTPNAVDRPKRVPGKRRS